MQVSERGRGIPAIAAMVNVTRLHNTAAAVSFMRRITALAQASKRAAPVPWPFNLVAALAHLFQGHRRCSSFPASRPRPACQHFGPGTARAPWLQAGQAMCCIAQSSPEAAADYFTAPSHPATQPPGQQSKPHQRIHPRAPPAGLCPPALRLWRSAGAAAAGAAHAGLA